MNNGIWKTKKFLKTDKLEWEKFSASDRDREYSPSSMIGGNYKPFIYEYESQSRTARAHTQSKIYQYGIQKNQVIEVTKISRSKSNVLNPILVFIHGGYWQELSIRDSFFPSFEAAKNGVGYAAIEYSLAPKVSIDEIVEECKNAIEWLFMNASDLGYDNRKIILAGSSAGAHLVAMCVLDKLKIKILGNILVSGIYDIEPLIDTSIDEALSLSKDEAYRNSPLNFSLKNFPPTIVAWGENETEQFKKQSKILVNKLIDEGVPVRSLEVIGKNHFDIILDLANFNKKLGNELKILLNMQS